jgi:hypothetical protein
MKLIRSKTFIISLISTISLGLTFLIILACGGGSYWDEELTGPSFFQENIRPKNISFFGRNEHFSKYNNIDDFKDVNVEEWFSFFEGEITKEILNKTLYNFDIQGIKEIKNRYNTNVLKQNNDYTDILQAFEKADKNKVSEFLKYLQYAKLCEPIATYDPSNWYYDSDENSHKKDTIQTNEILTVGNDLFKSCTTAFIKERYLFQLVRMYYFEGDTEKCQSYFTINESCFTKKTTMYWRSLAYYAGSLANKSRANYIFSLIFKDVPAMKETAYHSFSPIEETDWDATIEYAKTSDEKINLWRMFSLYTKDYERCINEVYTLNPKSEILDELLLNGINEFEENNIQYNTLNPFSEDFAKLVQNIANQQKTMHPNFWNLAAGYITTVNKDFTKSEEYLQKVEKISKDDVAITQQIRGIRIIGKIIQSDSITNEFEQNFVDDFTWLQRKEQQNNSNIQNILQWTKTYLAGKYFEQQEYVKSECLSSTKAYYKDYESLDKLLNFIYKSNKTPFETLLANCYSHTQEDIYGLQGFVKLYDENDAKAALELYKKSRYVTLLGDPFMIHLKDCHDCDHQAYQDITYNQVSFVQRIIDLQKSAETNKEKAAESYFLLGNAFYNMTYYGNARAMYQSDIFWDNWSWESNYYAYSTNQYSYESDVFWESSYISQYQKNGIMYIPLDCSKAKEYYVKAMNASNDKEFKAKCCMMAAKCEYAEFVNDGKITYEQYYIAGEFYEKMLKDYKKTKYFQEVINECSYFGDFVKSPN